jgi:hypothetical protein
MRSAQRNGCAHLCRRADSSGRTSNVRSSAAHIRFCNEHISPCNRGGYVQARFVP